MNIGCTTDYLSAFNTWLGRQADCLRVYISGSPTPPTSWSTVRTYALAGYQVLVSFNAADSDATMDSIAGGSLDATVTSIASYCETAALDSAGAGGEIWLCFCHEPENGAMTAAHFVPAASRVIGIIRANAPHVKTYNAYLGGFYRSQFSDSPSGRPDLWWPTPNSPDVLGVDYYNWRGASRTGNHWAQNDNLRPPLDLEMPPGTAAGADTGWDAPPGSGVNSWMELATHFGVPLCFPEFGCAVTGSGTPGGVVADVGVAGRAAYIQRFADEWATDPRILAMTYFDLDDNDGRVNWRLSGGVVAADAGTATAFRNLSVPAASSTMKVLLSDGGDG